MLSVLLHFRNKNKFVIFVILHTIWFYVIIFSMIYVDSLSFLPNITVLNYVNREDPHVDLILFTLVIVPLLWVTTVRCHDHIGTLFFFLLI